MADRTSIYEALLDEGAAFTYESFSSKGEYGYPSSLAPAWTSWVGRVEIAIREDFGTESYVYQSVKAGLNERVLGNGSDKFTCAKAYFDGALQAGIDLMKQGYGRREPIQETPARPPDEVTRSRKVFVVHGHDEALKNECEVFLSKHGLEPVVLHRQPDEGQTVIEKFEQHADVGYVFVLLTPDDIAFPAVDADRDESDRRTEFRARQNVIFEFGYFVGKLGRQRVCCLYKGEVAIPSDLAGLVYKHVSGTLDTVAYALLGELKAAGYDLML